MNSSRRERRGGRPGPWPVLVGGLLCGALTVSTTAAGDEGQVEPPTAGGEHQWIFFPDDDIYPQYIADPLRPQSALVLAAFPSSEIPDAGNLRFLLRLGGRYSIARRHPAGQPDRGFQIDFEGGFFSQFDMVNSLDNIGWDGLFGLRFSYKGSGPWAFSVATRHDSGHLGDEYVENTGRERIDATREEIVVGASWAPDGPWRIYMEAGWAYHVPESEEPYRLQAGVEYISREGLFRGDFPWYAALDTTLYKDTDLRFRACAQLGLIFPTDRATNRYRAALELVSGRSVLGEFSMHDETHVGLGWYFDF
ncbi:MAG TPA: DUF1207 domain-containing protein [Candidatus Polarisedimenticolia bacterium]|nr:DUF1207 domain-containing protein [Candidatus Polarisedimenticolia bacterium]